MGNGSSQSAELHKTASLIEPRYKRDIQRINKYASPQHKVLPAPVLGQKLKNTDNGHILSNGGTISGKKFAKYHNVVDETDPEVLAILNRRSAMMGCKEQFLSDSKRFHSDTDLANNLSKNNEKSSPSKARINRAKRKNKAPPPPEVDNKHVYKRNEGYRRSRESHLVEKNAARTKSPAPKPPAQAMGVEDSPVPPPPPPPPPVGLKINNPYERNRHNVAKLNDLNKSKDVSAKLSTENKFGKFHPNFHDDIKAALQQRLSSDGKLKRAEEKSKNASLTPLRQYYFSGQVADAKVNDVAKNSESNERSQESKTPKPPQQYYFGASIADTDTACTEQTQVKHKVKTPDNRRQMQDVVSKAVVERTFSASDDAQVETKHFEYYKNRERTGSQISQASNDTPTSWFNSEITQTRGRATTSGGYRRARSLSSSSSEGDVGIRMDLRPVLPAKKSSQDKLRFSPTEAWRSLSVDSILRNPSVEISSDDTESGIRTSYRTNKSGDSGIFHETDGSERYHRYSPSDEEIRKVRESNGKPHWTPEQDLSDDCESPVFDKSNSYRSQMVKVQPKLVTSTAFSSLPYMNYAPVDDAPLSPSEKVREKSRRTARRKSKASNKSVDSNGLQNLKKSMKAALSMNKKQNGDQLDTMNWSLSRSIPGSLNEIDFENRDRRGKDPSKRGYIASLQDRPELLLFDDSYRSLPQLNRLEKVGLRQGHVMYLPEYQSVEMPAKWRSKSKEDLKDRDEVSTTPPHRFEKTRKDDERRKNWFLSEVEKEMVEKDNEKQPEWMDRVEEEFRLKRDREKASIRQQLRILNLERNKYSRSVDGDIVHSSDSQESESPPTEYRYRSRSEDGLTSTPENERRYRSGSYHELRKDFISGPLSLPTIPPPPKNPLPPLDVFLVKKQTMHNDSSSSQASYSKHDNAQSKGFSRWFRKKSSKSNDDVRPEPEGGRSSGDEHKNFEERRFDDVKTEKKTSNDVTKRSSIYKQLNEIVEREEKFLESRRIGNDKNMNSAGESYSESDAEIRDDTNKFTRSSVTSSDDGNVECGFYSGAGQRKPAGELFQRYAEYGGQQRKVSAAYAQPFTPSKGYRPVMFNPSMKSLDKVRSTSTAKPWNPAEIAAS